MKTTTNTGTALKRLNDDFSNIEEVYSEMRNEWMRENPESTEIDFHDSFRVDTIDETQFKSAELANKSRLETYLGKKRPHVKRLPIDYYNQYKKNGKFKVSLFLKTYKKNEFKKVISELEEKKKIFLFIFDRLDEYGRIELQDDFIQHLEEMRDLQEHTKYKTIINNLIAEIEAQQKQPTQSKPDPEPQQVKDTLPDNPYPGIFEDAFAFRVFERLYDRYKDSNNLLADFSFIYRIMHKEEGMIKEYFRPEMYKSWLSKEPYSIVLEHGLKTLSNCTSKGKVNAFKDSIELVKKQYETIS